MRKRPIVDFSVSQAQTELAALSRQILTDRATPDRLAELERNGLGFDEALWADLAGAGVLAAALPDGVGDGYGLAEQCSILIEVGRTCRAGAVPGVDRLRGGRHRQVRHLGADRPVRGDRRRGRPRDHGRARRAQRVSRDDGGPIWRRLGADGNQNRRSGRCRGRSVPGVGQDARRNSGVLRRVSRPGGDRRRAGPDHRRRRGPARTGRRRPGPGPAARHRRRGRALADRPGHGRALRARRWEPPSARWS